MYLRMPILGILACNALLTGCGQPPPAPVIHSKAEKPSAIALGTLVSSRQVVILGDQPGVGVANGAAVGVSVGQAYAQHYKAIGNGSYFVSDTGDLRPDQLGMEYVVQLESGVALTIVQKRVKNEIPLGIGTHVVVQNASGTQRVLPADRPTADGAHP